MRPHSGESRIFSRESPYNIWTFAGRMPKAWCRASYNGVTFGRVSMQVSSLETWVRECPGCTGDSIWPTSTAVSPSIPIAGSDRRFCSRSWGKCRTPGRFRRSASRRARNCGLSSVTEHSFQGIAPSPKRAGSVTYVSGMFCHLCVGTLKWGSRAKSRPQPGNSAWCKQRSGQSSRPLFHESRSRDSS
jgi:hypothetical protein